MKGWDKETARHSAAKRFGKAPPYRTESKMPALAKPITGTIKLNEETYVDNLISISGYESSIVVSGGTSEPKTYPFYGGGCGFASLKGKGTAFKKYFEEENEKLREKYGFDVFYIGHGYPTGTTVSVSTEFSTYIAQQARAKIIRDNLPIPKNFVDYIEASAQQDMEFKEFIMNDIQKQIQYKFPNTYVETRLD
jgi:hypothetical protein